MCLRLLTKGQTVTALVLISTALAVWIYMVYLILVSQMQESRELRVPTSHTPGHNSGNIPPPKKKNVLFLVADDLRPEINAFLQPGADHKIHTPHLDGLASQSLVLKKAYSQKALCTPSRASFLTSRRPDVTRVYDIDTNFRISGGNFTTIPQYFKQNGYKSVGCGKVFHPGVASGNDFDRISWSEPFFNPQYQFSNRSWNAITNEQHTSPMTDEQTVKYAKNALKRLAPKAKSGDQPFFLAVGFVKPHLPFDFPEEFLKFYPLENIHLPSNPYVPREMPLVAWTNYGELGVYNDIHPYWTGAFNTSLPHDVTLKVRRAYYSCVSYVDSLVGQLLQELQSLGLEQNTIVSFIGDHGWQLGEHNQWCKHTNFEIAAHVPMMLRIPGLTDQGIVTDKLVELVDLFPTLVEAADLPPLPLCPENSRGTETCREGASIMPLINSPGAALKDRVFYQYAKDTVMGYSMLTETYRYTEWIEYKNYTTFECDWSRVAAVELYDLDTDPEENSNIASDTKYEDLKEQLSTQLREGWRAVAN